MSGASPLVSQLLRLLFLIQGNPGGRRRAVAGLADELGVTERTLYRHLHRLKEAGVPLTFDRRSGGYAIGRPFFLPPVDLTAEESCALLLLAERLRDLDDTPEGWGGLPLASSAATAMHKLRAALPAVLRDELDDLTPRITLHLARSEGDGIDDVWSDVARAIATQTTLHCRYEASHGGSAPGGSETFDLDPFELYFGQRAWYVIGHHHGRDARRTLRLSRFLACQPTGRTFTRPADFSLADFFGQAWRMIPGDRTRYDVSLRFSPVMAETVDATHWHPTQQTDWHDDGSLTVRFTIDGLDEIVWWILGYGPHCVVEEPAALRERVVNLLREAHGQYGA
jgi:proteasome accessory factor B